MFNDFNEAQMDRAQESARFAVIRSYLHHSGDNCNALPADQVANLYLMGDGYGQVTEEDLTENEVLWDWSHIRDSSPEALDRIFISLAVYLSAKLND